MMCSTRLILRFPPRERRWRTLSPEEASIGAVPVQDAKCPLSGNRVMSPTSTSSRAAPEGPMPCRVVSVVSVVAQQRGELLVRGLLAGIDPLEVHDQLHRDPLAGLADHVTRTHRREDLAGLRGGQVTLGAARNQFQHKGMQLVDLVRVLLARWRGAGRPGSAAPPAARRPPPAAARSSGCRPARPSGRRWRRSCGPARWRTPGPVPTASAAHRRPAHPQR